MEGILGIDIGGSATKIAGLGMDGTIFAVLRVSADNPLTSLYGALGHFLQSNRLALSDVRQVVLTGVGSSFVDGDVFSLPTRTVDEFDACGTGALALSAQQSAVVVSMGTGSAFLWAEAGGNVKHLCGSGIGGGTLSGLCRKLAGVEHFQQINRLTEEGDLGKVDLTIADITRNPPPSLDSSLTAANFGNLSEDATPADLAAGAVNLVLQAIGTMTVLACSCCDTRTVVATGAVATLPQAKANFQNFQRLYGIRYIVPENAAFATAIGAALYTLRKQAG